MNKSNLSLYYVNDDLLVNDNSPKCLGDLIPCRLLPAGFVVEYRENKNVINIDEKEIRIVVRKFARIEKVVVLGIVKLNENLTVSSVIDEPDGKDLWFKVRVYASGSFSAVTNGDLLYYLTSSRNPEFDGRLVNEVHNGFNFTLNNPERCVYDKDIVDFAIKDFVENLGIKTGGSDENKKKSSFC
jgi:hypothetical protein